MERRRDSPLAGSRAALAATQEDLRVLRAIVGGVPAVIGYWDRGLRNRLANDAYVEFFGFAPDQIHGMHMRDVVGAKLYESALPYMERALAGEEQLFDREIPTPSGELRYVQASYVPDAVDGEIRGFFVLATDITARRRAEIALEARNSYTTELLESLDVGIALVDDAGCVTDTNARLCELLRMERGRIVGARRPFPWTSPERVADSPQGIPPGGGWAERLEDRDIDTTAEEEFVRGDGSHCMVRLSQRKLSSGNGTLVTIVDITAERAAQAARGEATELFETAFSGAPSGVALNGLDRRFVRVNAALCEILGRTEDELIGSTSDPFTHPDDLQVTADAFTHLYGLGPPLKVEKRFVRSDGQVVWVAVVGIAVCGPDGQATHVVSHFNDITAFKLSQLRQAEATALFETAFADAPIGMALVALDGRWLKVNRVLCELTGYSVEELLERTFQEVTHPDDLDADLENVEQLLAGEIDRYMIDKRFLTSAGEVIWINLSTSLARDSDGQPQHFIAQMKDISERKLFEAELRLLADHDPLTELWNRRRFQDELERQLHRCQRYGERAGLLVADLDGFKSVNDTHGHKAGDDLLKQIANVLRACLRSTDGIARLGGDEFAVLLTHVTAQQTAQLAGMLSRVVSEAGIQVNGERVTVSASFGISVLDSGTTSYDDAMLEADAAMYRAKAELQRV
jgi:diguanylate cyclase (GGDEF)-like protein/PAS domain S-box-containing protein